MTKFPDGPRLRAAREQANLTVEEVAVATMRSARTVHNWESGLHVPPATVRPALRRALGLDR